MFCGKCGAENDDSARFCHTCGTMLLPQQPAPAAPVMPAPSKRSHKKLWLILTIAILVLSLGTTAYVVFNKNTPKNVAYAAMDAIYEADAEAMFNLFPEQLLEEVYSSRKQQREAMNDLEEDFQFALNWLGKTYGEWEIEYQVIDVQKLSGSALNELQEVYEDEYNCRVTAAKEVIIKSVLTAEDTHISETEVLIVVKIGGKWYLDYDSIF